MPLTHDMGLIGFHVNMLVYGMSQYIMSTDLFSRRPLLWMQKVNEKRASIICSPNFGFKHYLKLFAEKHSGDMDLSCVRVIVNGAEPISVRLCRQFLDTLSPYGLASNVMSPSYGLAEAGLSVSLTPPGTSLKTLDVNRHAMMQGDKVQYLEAGDANALEFVTEGPVARDCQARIGNAEGADLGVDRMGEVQIRGDNVTAGYYGDPENSRDLYTADGWLRTGDLGFIHDNEIVITGRLKEVIFVNGRNYYPHDIEATILEAGQIELGKVVAAGVRSEGADEDEILVFILHRGDIDAFAALTGNIKSLVSKLTGLEVAHVIPVKRIPKTTSGKIQRRFLVNDYLQGNFDHYLEDVCVSEDTASECGSDFFEKLLIEISQRVLPGKKLDRESNYFEVGASSLDITQIHERFGDLYPEILDITDFFEYPTVQELAAFIRNKKAFSTAGVVPQEAV
jgi:acyl-CoA synthetase (AMP-forming)/AMP-acid ligase II